MCVGNVREDSSSCKGGYATMLLAECILLVVYGIMLLACGILQVWILLGVPFYYLFQFKWLG